MGAVVLVTIKSSYDSYDEYLADGGQPIPRYEQERKQAAAQVRPASHTKRITAEIWCRPELAHEIAVSVNKALAPYGVKPTWKDW